MTSDNLRWVIREMTSDSFSYELNVSPLDSNVTGGIQIELPIPWYAFKI